MQSLNILTMAAESRFGKIHVSVLFWCFLVLILDGYDLAVAEKL